MKLYGLRIFLVVYALSFVLSCILGPRRGHSVPVSVLGGLALGPLNLILIWLLDPPAPVRKPVPPDQDEEG